MEGPALPWRVSFHWARREEGHGVVIDDVSFLMKGCVFQNYRQPSFSKRTSSYDSFLTCKVPSQRPHEKLLYSRSGPSNSQPFISRVGPLEADDRG